MSGHSGMLLWIRSPFPAGRDRGACNIPGVHRTPSGGLRLSGATS
jgi:hypothetical protein